MTEIDPSAQFVDTHAHLSDEQFSDDANDIVRRSAELGVSRIVNVAFSPTMWREAVTLSDSLPGVSYTVGVHPNSAGEWNQQVRDDLESFLSDHEPVAIGETGLDYYWNTHPREVQIEAFREQLDIARNVDLPVIIHMRGDVEEDIRALLDASSSPMCVFHSFDGSAALASWIIAKGWMIGAGGLMSRRSARELRGILKTVPAGQLFLETDSPYLSPTGWDQKRNSPESIPVIAGHLAKLRDESLDSLARSTTENAERVFRFPSVVELGVSGGSVA